MSMQSCYRISFLARLMHYTKSRKYKYFCIVIPSEVVEKYGELLRKWYENKTLLIVSIEELAGVPKR